MVEVTGMKNPVRAALEFLKALDTPVDEPSFERVAELRGDATPEQLGNGFVVRCYTPDEWKERTT